MKREHKEILSRQQGLVKMIFEIGADIPEETSRVFKQGLEIYQNNLMMTAARSLSLSYPVLEKMLSEETMVAVAREFLKVSRPDAGDWAEWGSALADWLASTPLAEESPFLPDVARLEWLMHQASRSAPASFDSSSLRLLSGDSLVHAHIDLAPSVGLLESNFPVDILWRAHQPSDGEFYLDTSALAKALENDDGACFLLIYQKNQVAQMKRLTASEYAFLMDVRRSVTVAKLIERHSDVDFISWLPHAIQEGLIDGLS